MAQYNYQEIEKKVDAFRVTTEGKQCLELFDKTFPSCREFSDFKKIDFYLWNLGK